MSFPDSKTNAVDKTTVISAAHLNNLETKVGIDNSLDANSIDYKIRYLKNSNTVFFDSTAGYYDFDAQVNMHAQRTDISASHKPAVYVQVTGKGDVTQINDYKIGIKSVAADKTDVVAATRGSLIGLHAAVIPLIARTTASYDDVVCLTCANEGTAKATEAIYIDHNAGVVGGQDFQIGINVACNSDYGITV